MGMEMADLHKVWEIKALKNPREDEAWRILENVAKQVQPIMRRRKWRVKILSEFCPANSSLLGLNVGKGVHVKLRLRRPRGNLDFFSYEEVLDTMLHELCHIEHGPHNALFYKLWDDIRKECEELIAKGIVGTGQGFDTAGRRFGGFSLQPPLSSLRKTSAAAAEKRQRINSLLPSGPNRLGGDNHIMTSLTPVQAAAMAAERRMLDDIWCASESSIVDVSDDDMDNGHVKRSAEISERDGKRMKTASSGSIVDESGLRPSIPNPPVDLDPICSSYRSMHWECIVCTLFNKPLALACDACGSMRPKDASDESKTWACSFCTLDNSVKIERCSACEEWRYSRGAPSSSRGPNLGT